MKKIFCGVLFVFLVGSFVRAEQLSLEQGGPIVERGRVKAGLDDVYYSFDKTILEDASGKKLSTINNTTIVIPIEIRYGLSEKIECLMEIPYVSNTVKTKDEVLNTESEIKTSGMADIDAGLKYTFTSEEELRISALANFGIPAGAKDLKEGFDIEPGIAVTKMMGESLVTANIRYRMTGEYTDSFDLKQNLGDIIKIGGAYAYPVGDYLFLITELIYESFGKLETAGVEVADSSGSRLGLVLGSRYEHDMFDIELGLDIALGDESARDYDYKVICDFLYKF
ncbi:MAG: hypothetical protein ABH857_04100 [Elusimicrobiota bacterium]